jgi:hypothetical protein
MACDAHVESMKCMMQVFSFSLIFQGQCELLPSLGIRRLSSVYFSHFNLLPGQPKIVCHESHALFESKTCMREQDKLIFCAIKSCSLWGQDLRKRTGRANMLCHASHALFEAKTYAIEQDKIKCCAMPWLSWHTILGCPVLLHKPWPQSLVLFL